jgi:transposase-like protein/IS1 family transposase
MDLAATFCPNLDCPARGQTEQGNLGIHSRKERRFICKQCHKTFTMTTGTAFYRRRTPAETVSVVLTLLAHGCPLQAIVVAFGFDERTVAAWFARAGRQAQAVQEHVVEQPQDLGQVQADEIRVKQQGKISWMALAMSVGTRLWLAGEVSEQRDLGLIRRLLGRVRRCAARRPLLVCTDGFRAYPRAIRETFRERQLSGKRGRPRWRGWKRLHIAQVVKHYVQRRVAGIEPRILVGPAAQVKRLIQPSQGKGGINTAYIERLNATFRERLASLTRRGRTLTRCTATLHSGMYLVGTVYNFCTYHTSLSRAAARARTPQTPAMAAALTDHRWTVQELLSFRVPPPRWTPPKQRGRPSRVLQCLVERWCALPRFAGELPEGSHGTS